MKFNIRKYIAAALAVAGMGAALTSCQNDYTIPELQVPEAKNKANITIREVKELWAGVSAEQVGVKPETGEHYIIHGRVISSDANGNVYKSLIIQDETAAVSFSINAASMYTTFPLGQEVVVDITGLYVGRYNNLFQIGMLSEYKGTPSIGFMDWEIFKRHTEKNGLPNLNFKYVKQGDVYPTENPYCILSSIGDLPTGDTERLMMQSQLVEFSDVKFATGGKQTFSTYQSSGDNRTITDASGASLNVRTSGYASFYNVMLPTGEGSIRGLLSVFGTDWQLTLRNIQDVMFGTHGSTMQDPNTVEEALEYDNNGRTAWTQGVIVGCVKAGVSEVTSAADIAWTEAEVKEDGMDDNLVIAPAADVRDIAKCMVVRLPQGSKFRKFGNLIDNPTVLGRKLVVRGKYSALYGMHGVTDNGGRPSDFNIEGVSTGSGVGDGSETNPFNPSAVIELEGEVSNAWVSGYIVGYVSGKSALTGARFTADTAGADYVGANLLIADSADVTDITKCIAVSVDRAKFGLIKNPGFYGKKITLLGNIGQFLGVQGMPSTKEGRVE